MAAEDGLQDDGYQLSAVQAAQILETQADRFASQGREKLTDAGKDTALFGGALAAGALAPTAMGVVGAGAAGVATYTETRALLENTETGRQIDRGVENFMDRGMQAGEALTDQLGGLMGYGTKDDRDGAQLTGRQASYVQALDRGTITLRDGVTREDLMDYLKNRNPAPSDKDGYTAEDYRAGLNELISRTPTGQKPTTSPATAESQAGGLSPGSEPVKTRQEQDLEDYNRLQAIKNLQGGKTPPAEGAAQDKPPEVPVTPPLPPPPEVGPRDPGGGDIQDFGADYIASQIVDKFGGIQDAQQRQEAIAGYLRNLRDAERVTGSGTSPQPGKSGGGFDPNLQLAMGSNVTGSVQQNRDQQSRQEAQQALESMGGAQAERVAADQNRQAIDQSRVQAQGQQTNQAIAANAQEVVAAQQILQTTRQNSLGNILLDAFMGGITSGTAVGIDRFGSIVGSAAGQQVTVNWGIQTPPPPVTISPPPSGTGSTGSQTGGAQTGSTSQTPTSTTVVTSPTTGTGSTASSTGSGTRTTQTASTSSGGTTTVSRPPVKPPSTGGSKSCRVAGTCRYTGYADKNGCCTVCGKKVAKK